MSQHILVLHDGKPGHFSQAQGVARLLARGHRGATQIRAIRARPKLKLLNRLLRLLAAMNQPWAQRLVSLAYRCDELPDIAPDIVVSFGGNVLALNVALSQHWRCRNVVIGNCYSLPANAVSANVTAFPTASASSAWQQCNVSSRVALCKTDAEQNSRAGSLLLEQAERPLWAMLVGGDGSGLRYQESDWHQLGQAMAAVATRHRIQWLLTTSRRSGQQAGEILGSYLDEQNCLSSIVYQGASSPNADAYLGAAERVFCTEDSLSMVSEAVAMHKPVIGLRPANSVIRGSHLRSLLYLQSQGLVERWAIADLELYQPSAFMPLRSYEQHLDSLYQRLQARLAITEPVEGEALPARPAMPEVAAR